MCPIGRYHCCCWKLILVCWSPINFLSLVDDDQQMLSSSSIFALDAMLFVVDFSPMWEVAASELFPTALHSVVLSFAVLNSRSKIWWALLHRTQTLTKMELTKSWSCTSFNMPTMHYVTFDPNPYEFPWIFSLRSFAMSYWFILLIHLFVGNKVYSSCALLHNNSLIRKLPYW